MAETNNQNKLIGLGQLNKLTQTLNSRHEEDFSNLTNRLIQLYDYIDGERNDLNTTNKTVIGAINELELESFENKADIIALNEYKLEQEDLPCYDNREYGSITLTYDGNEETKEVVNFEAGFLVKITDDVSINDLEGLSAADVTIYTCSSDGQSQEETVKTGGYEPIQENVYEIADEFVMLVLEDTKLYNEIDITKGLWFFHMMQTYGDLTSDLYAKSLTYNKCISGELKKIDEKYLEKKPGICSEGKDYTYEIFDDPDERTTKITVTHVGESGAESFNTTEEHESIAIGACSHAEGIDTIAYGYASHAEGDNNVALSPYSHVEGLFNYTVGNGAHAEGIGTSAMMYASHTEGHGTIANGEAQHAQGKYNIKDTEDKYAHIVGNGKYEQRSNAHTLDWDGNAWFAGKVTAEGAPTDAKDLVNKEYVDNNIGSTKLYYEDFIPFKEITEENITFNKVITGENPAPAFRVIIVDSATNLVSGNMYEIEFTINKKLVKFTMECKETHMSDTIYANSLDTTFYVDNRNYIFVIADKIDLENYDISDYSDASPIVDNNKTLIELAILDNNYSTTDVPEINNITIREQQTTELTDEFFNDHRFITEEERESWNDKVNEDKLITDMISENVLTLTTDKRQKVEIVDGTEIVLPTVTDFTEIHLYFSTLSDLTLIFPAGKYQKTPEIKANKTYEFIFTYIGEWLIGYIEYGN